MMGTRHELARAGGYARRDLPGFRAGLAGIAVSLCAVAAALGCGGSAEEPPSYRECLRNGASYATGRSVPAGDGCNTCSCVEGDWQCTAIACPGSSCAYDGQLRAEGSRFASTDGCNECICSGGTVACTERGCEPPRSCERNGQLLANGATVPAGDGCNSCTCFDGELGCTLIDCISGCRSNSDCEDSQYCAFPQAVCGPDSTIDKADTDAAERPAPSNGAQPWPPPPVGERVFGGGECRERPTQCSGEAQPVCGCDGVTYRTACAAASLGLSLARTGPCQ